VNNIENSSRILQHHFNTFDMNCFGGWFLLKEGNFFSDYGLGIICRLNDGKEGR